MLFLDICEVEAFSVGDTLDTNIVRSSFDATFYNTQNFYGVQNANNINPTGGSFANFEGEYISHIVFPIDSDTRSIEIDPDAYYYMYFQLFGVDQFWTYTDTGGTVHSGVSSAPSNKILTISNVYASDFNGKPIGLKYESSAGNWQSSCFMKGIDIINGSGYPNALGLSCNIHLTGKFTNGYPSSWKTGFVYFRPHYFLSIWSLKEEYKYNMDSTAVTDTIAHQQLETLNDSTEQIEDSVTNPTGTGILGTIKNFFNGFFGWLHDTILGLFVPESSYFTTWFTNVNTLLSDKLGMLYHPI